jgi:peptidoglycan hydrolase CwlO-like protein|tara:strand:- start:324 stop:752 length:429 start_codon:yes stop_codon:yes gene_type:complete
MQKKISVSEIASYIGVAEVVVQSVINRQDVDLIPYLDESIQSDETGLPRFSVEGLPLLVTKVSYNIPTADIIDNLSQKVQHLVSQQEEIKNLKKTNDQLATSNEQLQDLINSLTAESEELQVKLDEAESNVNWRNLFRRGKS